MIEITIDFWYSGLFVAAKVAESAFDYAIKEILVYSGDYEITHLISSAGFTEISAEIMRRYDDQRIEALR